MINVNKIEKYKLNNNITIISKKDGIINDEKFTIN